jgi:hypothetical protein
MGAAWSTYAYASDSATQKIDPRGLFNVRAWQVETYMEDPTWKFEFEFSKGCTSSLALELAGFIGPKFDKFVSYARRISGFSESLQPDAAGHDGISDLEKRCRCMNYDPELAAYFTKTLHGVERTRYTREQAEGFVVALSQEYYRLRKKKCGGDAQCRAANDFYDWDDLLNRAQARGLSTFGNGGN